MLNYCLDIGIPLIAVGAMTKPLGAFIAALLADENALGTGHRLTPFYLCWISIYYTMVPGDLAKQDSLEHLL